MVYKSIRRRGFYPDGFYDIISPANVALWRFRAARVDLETQRIRVERFAHGAVNFQGLARYDALCERYRLR